MADEGFLRRWSRRKRTESASSAEPPPSSLPPQAREGSSFPPPRTGAGREGVDPQANRPNAGQEEDEIDPATLPPLESLGVDSDYTVFLKKGVPESLRIAALRRAWMTDPFIRDFRGPAEYALDYTTSEFDLRPTDDVAKMLDQIFPPATPVQPITPETKSASSSAPAPEHPAAEKTLSAPPAPKLPQDRAVEPAERAEAEPREEMQETAPRRRHGGALPG